MNSDELSTASDRNARVEARTRRINTRQISDEDRYNINFL